MNRVMAQVLGVVVAVALFAGLSAVGYFTQLGISQSFGNGDEGNLPRGKRGWGNRPLPSNDLDDITERDPIPEGESVWKDWEDKDYINQKRHLRPGNYEVLEALMETLRGWHAVEFKQGPLAFPYWQEDDKYESQEAYDRKQARKEDRAREGGEYLRNPLRLSNFEIQDLMVITLEEGESDLPGHESFGMSDKEFERFKTVRATHPERCALVLLNMDLHSMVSADVRKAKPGNPLRLTYVKKSDGWKLVSNED